MRFPHTISFSPALRSRWYWIVAVLLTLVLWLVVALLMRPLPDAQGSIAVQPYGLTTSFENQALDLLFQIRDARQPARRVRGREEPITIVAIDDGTLRASGLRAPNWPRSNYAQLIDTASMGGASVIGLDLLLMGETGPSAADKKEDEALAAAIQRAGNVVIAEKTPSGGIPAITPHSSFAQVAWSVGFVDLPLDSDGVLRSVALRIPSAPDDWQLSFAARLVEGYRFANIYDRKLKELSATGIDNDQAQAEAMQFAQIEAVLKESADGNLYCGQRWLPFRTDGLMQLDFRGRPTAFRTISAQQVLNRDPAVTPDLFRDRIVLIAQTSPAAGDYFATPFFESAALIRLLDRSTPTLPVRTSGIEIHATSIATMLNGNSPRRPRYRYQILFVLFVMLLSGGAVFLLRARWASIAVLLIVVMTLIVCSWVFNSRGMILPLASSWLSLGFIVPAGLGLRYARERALHEEKKKERQQIMDIFSRVVSPGVAEKLWHQRDQITLRGERRVVTLIFTDIRNFTTLSETTDSESVVEWLTEYFARMNAIVTQAGGHISKFIGDGLMIVFGAPLARTEEEEARAAVECGVKMLAEVNSINQDWKDTGRPEIRIGVGIHTGEATCGVVGSAERLEYTIIGDTVNLAARLESKTKDFGVSLLLSEATVSRLNGSRPLKSLGPTEVKGKLRRINVFTVEGV